ncbi:cation transporter [Sphingomonas jejuensis]|nr:cation transporter [Sphingomonas jejuensis]
MSAACCGAPSKTALDDPRWRRALWIALAVNAAMFAAEMGAGLMADSLSLRADALDFLGDAANYAISLVVAGAVLAWRARAALLKGATLALFGVWIIASAVGAALDGSAPQPHTMGVVGVLALLANVGVAIMLYRFRTGDANMRSVWICSRNDAVGNFGVVAAALGVFGTGSAWPDLGVAIVMAGLSLWGGFQIISQARSELRTGAGDNHARIVVGGR